MKISIKISKDGLDSLNFVLQKSSLVRSITREERTNKSILEEVARKVYLMHGNFTGNKPKKFNLKYHQASVLEYWLRSILPSVSMINNDYYLQIHKIANELHQELV
ncbi:hypothetical protein [Capnocytophaga felis]|uniref:Uncharacterized protein n=1 Tax=Capnocytophaga felis TaxID=2267611 RepID=A0A5M4BA54_9FLAO|nr:hypothetical protein [Capnocytophaga felis]GET46484.1 hypothetical protein RCZ01_17860 [Capnocytophaga felis]GET48374.1 hypothetical protein RCZ02_12050 [Capnocytophaga felis]